MTPLLSLLLNGLPAGVWHLDRFDSVQRRLVEAFGHQVVLIDLDPQAGKLVLLDRVAARLGFPEWFGRNWDALHDALFDRFPFPGGADADSPPREGGRVELIVLRSLGPSDGGPEHAPAEAVTTLVDIFAEVADEAGLCLIVAGLGAGRIPTAP